MAQEQGKKYCGRTADLKDIHPNEPNSNSIGRKADKYFDWLLTKTIGAIEPELLSDFTRANPKALLPANAEESNPPGLIKLVSTFWNKDFRRGLAAFNDLFMVFGRHLTQKTPRPLLPDKHNLY
jgi:hypothetical protein